MEKQSKFFPQELVLTRIDTKNYKITKSNGGWSDPRDHELCKSIFEHQNQFNQSSSQ